MLLNITKILKGLAVAVLLCSCTASVSNMRRQMTAVKGDLDYLYTTNVAKEKKPISIGIEVEYADNALKIPSNLKIKKDKSFFIYLFIMYLTDYRRTCTLGNEIMKDDFENFFKKSLTKEFERSGNMIVDNNGKPDYTLKVKIDSAYAQGKFTSYHLYAYALLFYIYQFEDKSLPAFSKVVLHYTLEKNNQVVMKNNLNTETAIPTIYRVPTTTYAYNQGYTYSQTRVDPKIILKDLSINLSESLGESIKLVNEEIVKEVNFNFKDY